MKGKRSREGIRWQDEPDPQKGPFIPVLSPKLASPLRTVILSRQVIGVKVHWLHGRTRPCSGEENNCEGCAMSVSARWKGYLAGWLLGSSRLCLVELTAQAVRKCPRLMAKSLDLRGFQLTLKRVGKAPNAPVSAELIERRIEGELPEAFDVPTALRRVWFGDV